MARPKDFNSYVIEISSAKIGVPAFSLECVHANNDEACARAKQIISNLGVAASIFNRLTIYIENDVDGIGNISHSLVKSYALDCEPTFSER